MYILQFSIISFVSRSKIGLYIHTRARRHNLFARAYAHTHSPKHTNIYTHTHAHAHMDNFIRIV